jgi:hypothetical protein
MIVSVGAVHTVAVVFIFVVFSLTFALRAVARMGKPIPKGSDPYANLAFVNEIRRLRHRIPDRLSTLLTGGNFAYPPMLHLIVSFFSKQAVERFVEPYWGAMMDAIQAVVVYVAATVIFRDYLILEPVRLGAFVAGFTFATTPILVRIIAGQFFISARPLGNLLFTCAVFMGLFHMWDSNVWWLLAMIPFVAGACMSSKFTVQNIVLIFAFALVLGGWWEFLVVFALSELLAILVTAGKHLRVLRHHVGHLWLYATRLRFKHEMIQKNKSLSDRLWLVLHGKVAEAVPKPPRPEHPLLVRLLGRGIRLCTETPELVGLSHMPTLIFLAVVIAQNNRLLLDPAYRTLATWVGCGGLLTILVSFRYLRFLGEPERYLGYVVFPLSVLIAFHLVRRDIAPLPYVLTTVYSLLVIAYHVYAYRRSNQRQPGADPGIDLARVMNNLEPSRVVCVPTILAKELMYRAEKHQYLCFAGANLGSTPESFDEFDFIFSGTYPYPRTDLEALVERYQCTRLVMDLKNSKSLNYDLSRWQTCYQNDGFALYDFVGTEREEYS